MGALKSNYITTRLRSKTGIQRDGTIYDSENYVDGQHCRFYKGAARKMGGYRALTVGHEEIVRNMFSVPASSSIDLYMGRASTVGYNNVTWSGSAAVFQDRTPDGFTFDENNQWCFDSFTQTITDPASYICAHVTPNLLDMTSTTNGPIYFGSTADILPLEPIADTYNGPITCSGGIVYAPPVMVAYGNDGTLQYSAPGDLTIWSHDPGHVPNQVALANTKLIKAYRTRGASQVSILIWGVNNLLRADYNDAATFAGTTLTDDITVLSPNCIVKYNQIFFWIGVDQFYTYNGITQKLPNTMSTDWFFGNLNYDYRSKVFGIAVPRYGEIMWFYPSGNATECDAVVIFNVEEKTWYDTRLSRSAGIPSTTFRYPILADNEPYIVGGTQTYPIWQHEYRFDKVIGGYSYPIESSFKTHYLDMFSENATNNILMRVRRIEPDFFSTGPMSVEVHTREFPQDTDTVVGPVAFDNTTKKIDDVTCQGRLVSVKFKSFAVGGFYQGGHTILDYQEGDVIP